MEFVHSLTPYSGFDAIQIAVGTKSGELLLYDVSTSSLVETIPAHTATIWSMHVRADDQALVTGSADKDVKFWSFEWEKEDGTVGAVQSSEAIANVPFAECRDPFVGAHSHPQNDRRHPFCPV